MHVVTKFKHFLPAMPTPVSSHLSKDVSVAVVSTSRLFVSCRARRLGSFPAVVDAVDSKAINVIEEQ